MIDRKNGLTYADSGVDIDAGNRLVDLIKPLVRATRRPGADAEIGGFGGLFDLKAAGFKRSGAGGRRPTASAPRSRSRSRPACIRRHRHRPGGDVASTTSSVQGAEPLFFLDYFACGKLDPKAAAAIVRRRRRGLPGVRLRADRRRDRRDARPVQGRRLRPRRLRGRRGRARHAAAARRPDRRGDAVIGLASSGVHSNGFSLVRTHRGAVRRSACDAPAPFVAGQDARRRAAGADAALRASRCLRAIARDRRDQGAGAYHRRRLHRQYSARAAEGSRRRASISPAHAGAAGVQMAGQAAAASPSARCCAPSTAASA